MQDTATVLFIWQEITMEHNRFVIETMSFCQGNCSGCFFSEQERVNGSFISSSDLTSVVDFICKQAKGMSDVSINFGQGDHLAVKDSEWLDLLFHVKQFKHLKPLITISTSAIERFDLVKKRTDELHQMAVDENMNLFFAVVLDPKKLEHKTFKDRYIQNINYIRDKFGFIDLTINVGEDTLNYFPPEKLDEFLLQNKFRHLELNLIPTVNTVNKFSHKYKEIVNWFISFKEVSKDKPYLVFHHYHFNEMNKLLEKATISIAKKELQDFLTNNFYIDFDLKVSSILSGYTGNAIPLSSKTNYEITQYLKNFREVEFEQEQSKHSSSMVREVLKDKNCSKCKYNKLCLLSGVMIFKDKAYFALHQEGDCFLGVKRLWNACENNNGEITGVSANLIPKGLPQVSSFGIDES